MTEYIYIISHPDGWRKIGLSSDPNSRLIHYQGSSIETLIGEWVAPAINGLVMKKLTMDILEDSRMMGEWFIVDSAMAKEAVETATGTEAAIWPANAQKVSILPIQCLAARALLQWSRNDLFRAAATKTSILTIANFENGEAIDEYERTFIVEAFESAGVHFIPANHGGVGVQLRSYLP